MGNFIQIIKKLNDDYEQTMAKNAGEAYSRLSTIFEELGSYLREYTQDLTKNDIKKIIQKLKGGEAITDEDKEQIKLWVVGDAEYYAKMENNFEDWKGELKRIIDEINKFRTDDPDIVEASQLRALLRDGSRVLADMFYYIQQKDRLDQFNQSIQDIDSDERDILIRLLEQKIKSQDF
jgi:hypothetical protein